MAILDLHTHRSAPYPEGMISLGPSGFEPVEGQLYSVGIHPWDSMQAPSAEIIADLERVAALPCVAAIGECGYDALKGGPAFRQLQLFKKHVEISEALGKPMVIHDVKGHDIIIGLRRDLAPKQKWVVHGMRNNANVARMLLVAGLWISFGEKFNQDALKMVLQEWPERLLVETDESQLSIEEIISNISATAGIDLTELLEKNTKEFLGI